MISGLIMGISAQIARKIIEKKYAGTYKASDEALINQYARQYTGLVALVLLAVVALLVWAIIAIVS